MQRPTVALIAGCVTLALASFAIAGYPTERFTSFAEIRIKSPLVQGTLWIDAGGLEAIQQLDSDGDFEYSADELNAARFFLGGYLHRNFLIMWDHVIRPIKLNHLDVARRPGSNRPCFRIEFRLTDLPPRQQVSIVSRLLSELSPEARTYAKIESDAGWELCVLGPTRFFSSDRTTTPIPPDSTFRPDAQRGRIASVGDWSIEMLYALPEGTFHIYSLAEDQHTPVAIAENSLDVSIQPGKEGPYRPFRLTARPQPGDKPGHSSRFSLNDPQFSGYSTFNADIRIGAGPALKRVIFEFPKVVIPAPTSRPTESPRRGCANLCPGIELKTASIDKCPHCGGKLLPLTGDTVPGLFMIGAHGGALVAFGGQGERFEALVTPNNEFRVYLTNERFETLPLKKLTGSAHISQEERFHDFIEIQSRRSADGRYLFVNLPETVTLPVYIRWLHDFHEGEGASHLDFMFEESVAVPQTASQPATTSQTTPPATATPAATSQPG